MLVVIGVLILAVILAWLMNAFRKRPKPVPPKPKELPWVVAMRRLDKIRGSGLLSDEAFEEFSTDMPGWIGSVRELVGQVPLTLG